MGGSACLDGFAIRNKGPVVFLEVVPLSDTGVCRAAFSSRLGGVSRGAFAELNVGFDTDDDPSHVTENRRWFSEAIGYAAGQHVLAKQVHGVSVRAVANVEAGAEGWRVAGEHDALITDNPAIILTVLVADCAPIFLVDTVRRAAGLVHAGWRGTVGHIVGRTLRAMGRAYGTEPFDCCAAIGPSIGACCFEVDHQVIGPLSAAFPAWRRLVTELSPGRWAFDIKRANRVALEEEGVLPDRITESGLCTSCRPDLFYSHRASGGRTGRHAAVLQLIGAEGT